MKPLLFCFVIASAACCPHVGSSGGSSTGGSATGASAGGCPGIVNVAQGFMAGGTAGQAMAGSAFYPFGPRVVLAGTACGGSDHGNSSIKTSIIRLDLPAGIAPGTYQFLPDGGSPFQVLYDYATPSSAGSGIPPRSGTLTLTTVDPTHGVQGSYAFDFGGATLHFPETGSFTAPVCDLCGLGGTALPDAGDAGFAPLDDAGIAACDHYYAARFERCGGPTLPASENARLTRFEQVCQNEAALPGSGVTASALEACASVLDASPCQFPWGPPEACNFHGSLPGGAGCTDGIQCESGSCSGTVPFSPWGPTEPFFCGTCEPLAALGQDCSAAGCPANSLCLVADPTAPSATFSCVATTQGGPNCNDLTAYCQPGLYCAAKTATCQPLATVGATCGDGNQPPGQPGGCAAPAWCSASSLVCTSSGDGGGCLNDSECAPGLGCLPTGPCSNPPVVGCASSGECGPIAWADPGQPCSLAVRCRVGSCFANEYIPVTQGPDAGLLWGTCPTVIPDGQPCTVDLRANTTCDTFSECFQGVCTLHDSFGCQ